MRLATTNVLPHHFVAGKDFLFLRSSHSTITHKKLGQSRFWRLRYACDLPAGSLQGKAAPGCSRFLWNDVFFRSFQSGYLSNWTGSLLSTQQPRRQTPLSFLDKRFYHSSRVEIDLQELALRKVRLTGNYNTAQMKRSLLKGNSGIGARLGSETPAA